MSQKNTKQTSKESENVQNCSSNVSFDMSFDISFNSINSLDASGSSELLESTKEKNPCNFFGNSPSVPGSEHIGMVSTDDLLEKLFADDLLSDPRNASLMMTSLKIQNEDYKRQLKQSQEESENIYQVYKELCCKKKEAENQIDLAALKAKHDQEEYQKIDAANNITTKEEQLMQHINELREKINHQANEKDQILREFQNLISHKDQEINYIRSKYESQINGLVFELNSVGTMLSVSRAQQNELEAENNSLKERLTDMKEKIKNLIEDFKTMFV